MNNRSNIKKKKSSLLNGGDFVQIILQDVQPYIAKSEFEFQKNGKFKKPKADSRKFNQKDKYIFSVFHSYANFSRWCESVDTSIDMLYHYNSKHASKVSRFVFIGQNVENYYIRVTAVFDKLLLIVNSVLLLNLKEESITRKSIYKHLPKKLPKDLEIKEKLDAVYNALEKIRSTRQALLHRNAEAIEGFDMHSVYELVCATSPEDDFKKELQKHLNLHNRLWLKDLRREMYATNNTLQPLLEDCLVTLIKIYEIVKTKV